MDVIDRNTRRKIGHCSIPLRVPRPSSTLTLEDVFSKLRLQQALCEIKALETHKLLGVYVCALWSVALKFLVSVSAVSVGYLVVNMDIQWSSLMSSVSSEWFAPQGHKLSSPVPSSVSSLHSPQGWRHERTEEEVAKSPRQKHVHELLVKGRALLKSMELAVDTPVSPGMDAVALNTEARMLPLPHVYDLNVSLDRFSVGEQGEDADADEELVPGPAEVLEMTFELLEFEPHFVMQLRRMRDASVSTRFRPMQIAVSHSDIATLFQAADDKLPLLPAFTIEASLRKRFWRPSRLLTLSLPKGYLSRSQKLWFFIRCGIDDHTRRARKREMNATRSVLLSGSVTGDALLAAANDNQQPLKVALHSQDRTNTRLGYLSVIFRLRPLGPGPSTSVSSLDESYESSLLPLSSPVKRRTAETKQLTEMRPIYESPLQLAVTIEQVTMLNIRSKINQLELQSSAAIQIQYAAHPFAIRGNMPKTGHKFVKRKLQCASNSSTNVTVVFNHTEVFLLPKNEDMNGHSSLLVGSQIVSKSDIVLTNHCDFVDF